MMGATTYMHFLTVKFYNNEKKEEEAGDSIIYRPVGQVYFETEV